MQWKLGKATMVYVNNYINGFCDGEELFWVLYEAFV